MFTSADTLAVYASDMERAKKFYTDVLGFRVRADLGPSLCFLESENRKIDIYLESGMKPAQLDNQTCRTSFFLRAEKTAAETYAALKAAGVKLLQENPEPVSDDLACFQLLDPDGNILEVCGAT